MVDPRFVALREGHQTAVPRGWAIAHIPKLINDSAGGICSVAFCRTHQALLIAGASRSSCTNADAVMKPTARPFWQAANPRTERDMGLPVPLFPTAMMFSLWEINPARQFHHQPCLFNEGMAWKYRSYRDFWWPGTRSL